MTDDNKSVKRHKKEKFVVFDWNFVKKILRPYLKNTPIKLKLFSGNFLRGNAHSLKSGLFIEGKSFEMDLFDDEIEKIYVPITLLNDYGVKL